MDRAESPSTIIKPITDRRPLLLLAVAVFFLHVLVTGGHLMSPDEELIYRTSESIAFSGTTRIVPLEADIATGLLPQGMDPASAFSTRVGREPNTFYAQYQPLQPLLAVPFVYTARLLEDVFAEGYAARMWPGMTIEYLKQLPGPERARAIFRRGFVVMTFAPLISALSALLLARLGKLLTGNRKAGICAAVLYSFATMAWPHARTLFTEPLAALFAFAALDQISRWFLAAPDATEAPLFSRHALLAGVFLGLANLTRVDAPAFTAGFVIAMAALAGVRKMTNDSWGRRSGGHPVIDVFLCGAIATSCWAMLQLFNYARFGVDLTSGYADQAEGVAFSTPILIGLHGLFMSPGKGMFFFSPALLLGMWGWMRAPVRFRWLVALTLVGYVPFFLAMAMWQNWAGGWCWGPRHVMQVHLPIMLGSVFLFTHPLSFVRRWIVGSLFVIGVLVQLYGSSQSPLEYYREFFLTYRDASYHTVNIEPLQAQTIARDFVFAFRASDGTQSADVNPGLFPAPILDSIYVPQHSQWTSYHQMWRLGFCDWFWWNMVSPHKMPDRWSGEP